MVIIAMKCSDSFRKSARRGFSLVEALMVVAVLSTLTAGAVFTISNVTRAAENTKLQRDVTVINNAIRTYMVNGGTFLRSDLANPAAILNKLKTRATVDSAKEIAGLRDSMIDARLTFEMQSSAEAAVGVQRARFIPDLANPKFVIQTDGPPGIRKFVMDASLAANDFGTEARRASMKLAKTDPWVWDYQESSLRRAEPSLPPTRNANAVNPNPPDAGNLVLNPPGFSLPAGAAPLISYPRSLALLPTNPAGTAQIFYSVNGSPFSPYAGPFAVDPGMTVTGVSVSLDPDRYDDSPSSSRTYTTTPVTPWAVMIFGKSGYDYFELGGEAAPGTPPPLPSGSVNGTGLILNLFMIPSAYQNSSIFRFVWTQDGTDPLTSASATQQADFTGGFSPTAIPLPLSAFGSSATATVKSAVKAVNRAMVNDSLILSRTLNAAPLTLRAPLINIDGRDVTLTLNVNSRDMPKDARIYYTTDGTDPGSDAAGNPQRGTRYTGAAFTLQGVTGSNQTIRARVYAPPAYMQFFRASGLASTTLILPAATSVYVGGDFVNSGGSLMRNIALLNNSGQVDTRFDTGSGASDDSLVGVVRQTGNGIMAGGDFETLNGSPRPGVVRLNANGSVDATFDADLSTN